MRSSHPALARRAAWRVVVCGLLVLLERSPARAQDPANSHAPPPVERFEDDDGRLREAIADYQSGQYDQALASLSYLLSEDDTSAPLRVQALVYLSEVFLALGNEESARESFRAALRLDPELRLDPFEHPPDVCAFFEIVRNTVPAPQLPEIPPATSPPPPRRAAAWIPLGIPQQRQGRAGAASLLATSQGLSCGLSVGLNLWLSVDRRYSASPEDRGDGVHSLETLRARRNVQWASTAACQLLYGVGVADAALWQRRQRARTEPDRGGPRPPAGLGFSGRF